MDLKTAQGSTVKLKSIIEMKETQINTNDTEQKEIVDTVERLKKEIKEAKAQCETIQANLDKVSASKKKWITKYEDMKLKKEQYKGYYYNHKKAFEEEKRKNEMMKSKMILLNL